MQLIMLKRKGLWKPLKDIVGVKFTRLLVLKRAENGKRNKISWWVRCDCGKELIVPDGDLTRGHTKSCGCYKTELTRQRNEDRIIHGKARKNDRARLYRIWSGMKSRCYNQNVISYQWYGKKSICICRGWKNNYTTFEKWAVNNGYASNLTIDRINPEGNYKPSNCRWITNSENTRRSNARRWGKAKDDLGQNHV
jgi:hypothetical protein